MILSLISNKCLVDGYYFNWKRLYKVWLFSWHNWVELSTHAVTAMLAMLGATSFSARTSASTWVCYFRLIKIHTFSHNKIILVWSVYIIKGKKYGLQTFTILVGNRRKEVIQAVFFKKKAESCVREIDATELSIYFV